MHLDSIIEDILSLIKREDYTLFKFSLICSEEALTKRLQKDVDDGMRENDIIERALQRITNYYSMDTIKIDVSEITPNQAAKDICEYIIK